MKSSVQISLLADTDDIESQLVVPPKPSQKCAKSVSYILGGIGAGAGLLYWDPSGTCVKSPTCGQPIADFFSSTLVLSDSAAVQTARWILLLSGAIGYSGSNMYYSSQFYDNFTQYLGEQKSLAAKITKGTFIIAYGTGQLSHIFLSILGTGGEALSLTTLLTVGGALPGNLFGATGVAKNVIPQVYSKLTRVLTEHVYYPLHSPKDETERLERERIKHYMQEQILFLKQAEANLKKLIANTKTIEINTDDLLAILFQQHASITPESGVATLGRWTTRLGAVGLTANFLYPLVKNTFDLMKQFIPYTSLQLSLITLLSASSFYNSFKITVEGIDSLYKNIKNILTGQPIDSLAFQLKPKTMALIVSLCSTVSILSFALVNVMWDKCYDGPAKNELRHGARAGIDINHAYALILFCINILVKLTKEPQEKLLFKIEGEVSRLKMQSPKDFTYFAENLDEQHKKLYGIHSYTNQQPKPRSSWCSWFRCGKKNPEPEEIEALEYKQFVNT